MNPYNYPPSVPYGIPQYAPYPQYPPTMAPTGYYAPPQVAYPPQMHPQQIGYPMAPQLTDRMNQASQVFRMFDTNRNGHLDKQEWRRAMSYMGMANNFIDSRMMFHMADKNFSQRVSEKEFVDFWMRQTY